MGKQSKWFVQKNNKTYGPFTSKQLKQLADEATIGPSTPIRRGSDGEWVAARRVKGLFARPAYTARCSHCNAKLKLLSEKLAGTELLCPKCKMATVLKASTSLDPAPHEKSSADTHAEIDQLSQTDPQTPSPVESPIELPTSDVLLKGLSGELAPLEEDVEADTPSRRRYEEEDDDDGTPYRLSTDAIPTVASTPFKFDEGDDDDWDGADDEADDQGGQLPLTESAPDEMDLLDALEGLAKQERSKAARPRKKTAKRSPPKREHR